MAEAGQTEKKVVLTLPNLGLKEHEVESLKTKFHNTIVESLGGHQAMAARRIVIVIVVVILE
jgi:hypothetical protein